MSLHTLAQHLQSAGRGDDKILVHMTPREVGGLQSLAMAHGGSLTINPETGLPEAGFLSGILPMLAGAALTVGSGGAINPLTASMIVGGAGAVATGSLQKGLMMGLGAYGGAGLGAGLAGAGAAGAAVGATPSVAPAANVIKDVANPATMGQTMGSGAMQIGTMPTPTMVTPPIAGVQGYVPGTPSQVFSPQEALARNIVQDTAPQTATQGASSVEAATSAFDRIASIPGKAYDLITASGPEGEAARKAYYDENKRYMLAAGIGALSTGRDEPKMGGEALTPTHSYDYNRRFSPSSLAPGSSSERMWFAADGGLANLPVEQMSRQASTGQNTNYPMANIRPYGYAVPRNNPVSENVFKPMDYQNVDPYTGEQKFDGGGIIALARGGKSAILTAPPKTKQSVIEKVKSAPKPAAEKPKEEAKPKETAKPKEAAKPAAEKAKPKPAVKKPEFVSDPSVLSRARGITEKKVAPGKEKIDASGNVIKEYQPINVTSVLNNWDNTDATRDYVKKDRISKIFSEIVGREPTPEEMEMYRPGGVYGFDIPVNDAQLAAQISNRESRPNTDLSKPRGKANPFTDDEFQELAKRYWGRELDDDELRAFKVKQEKNQFPNLAALRNTLTKDPNYSKFLNAINEASFTGQDIGFNNSNTEYKIIPRQFVAEETADTTTSVGTTGGVSPSGVSAVPTAKPMTPEEIEKYKVQYGGYSPVSEGTSSLYQKPVLSEEEKRRQEENAKRLYNPQYVASPLYTFGDAMAYQDVNKQLGLQNLYEQMAEKMPDLQSGLKYSPTEGQTLASPFASTTPGLVTLQSVAKPEAYVPPTPVLPNPTAQAVGLTPQEQALLSTSEAQRLASLQGQPQKVGMATGGYAGGGYHLGDYSDGGRLLKGPGDGVSDSIPASIGGRQPARLADGEFVIPARIVSELGNGSTDAGARKLYAMMDRIQRARRKSVGRDRVAVDSKAEKLLPA